MRALAAYRGVLAIRDARALIGASAASQVGDWLYNAALLAYVFHATHSAVWVGAATICRLLPYVLLGPFGGVIADRHPRRVHRVLDDGRRRVHQRVHVRRHRDGAVPVRHLRDLAPAAPRLRSAAR